MQLISRLQCKKSPKAAEFRQTDTVACKKTRPENQQQNNNGNMKVIQGSPSIASQQCCSMKRKGSLALALVAVRPGPFVKQGFCAILTSLAFFSIGRCTCQKPDGEYKYNENASSLSTALVEPFPQPTFVVAGILDVLQDENFCSGMEGIKNIAIHR
jgi:hypothetical protein